MKIDNEKLKTQIDQFSGNHITPTLFDYIKISNKSPALDKDWEKDGHMGRVLDMAMIDKKSSEAQFVITDVLGPKSNAHGPNGFLHIPYAKKLTCCIASIINDFS